MGRNISTIGDGVMDKGLIRQIAEYAYNSENEQVSNAAAIVLQQPSLYQGFKVKRIMSKQDIIHWIDDQIQAAEVEIFFDEDDDIGFTVENQGYNLGRIEGKKEVLSQIRSMLTGV